MVEGEVVQGLEGRFDPNTWCAWMNIKQNIPQTVIKEDQRALI